MAVASEICVEAVITVQALAVHALQALRVYQKAVYASSRNEEGDALPIVHVAAGWVVDAAGAVSEVACLAVDALLPVRAVAAGTGRVARLAV